MQLSRIIHNSLIHALVWVVIFALTGNQAVLAENENSGAIDTAHEGTVVVKTLSREDVRKGKRQWSFNTGFVVGGKGEVVTSLVAVHGAGKIRVVKLDGRKFKANIKAYHQPAGLALLHTEIEDEGLILASRGPDSDDRLMIATIPCGCGPEHGLVLRSSTIASADAAVHCFGVRHHELVTINTHCPTGAAAAPVLTKKGKVAGVVLSAMKKEGPGECVYVFPVKKLRPVIQKLQKGQNVRVGWLGVAITQLKEGKGALVRGVLTTSPAHEAGVRPGDVVVSVGEKDIDSPDELVDHINTIEPGSQLAMEVRRGSEGQTLQVKVGQRPLQIHRVQRKSTEATKQGGTGKMRTMRPERNRPDETEKELKKLRRRVHQLEQRLRERKKSGSHRE